ncbi:MAG: retroviral-like aspartic protease family protein [Planctomycetes bacterium]|nr:retroviral-like aspartic protease family protein [Planctomycetota bacterium]
MGLTFIVGTVTGPRKKKARARFLVDSGATYTLLPEKVWRAIGLKGKRKETFVLADGTTMDRRISECHIRISQGDGHTPVILGEPGDAPLLGVVTLEELGLMLNPFTRKLLPMRMMLACVRPGEE